MPQEGNEGNKQDETSHNLVVSCFITNASREVCCDEASRISRNLVLSVQLGTASYQPYLLHSTDPTTTYHVSMAITSAPISPGYIQTIQGDAELLFALKELKNSIIGNTWKKVEVADSDGLVRL